MLYAFTRFSSANTPTLQTGVVGQLVGWQLRVTWLECHGAAETTMFKGLLPSDLIVGYGSSVSPPSWGNCVNCVTAPLAMTSVPEVCLTCLGQWEGSKPHGARLIHHVSDITVIQQIFIVPREMRSKNYSNEEKEPEGKNFTYQLIQ